jgi:beta-barrel assembly-enhancing protease
MKCLPLALALMLVVSLPQAMAQDSEDAPAAGTPKYDSFDSFWNRNDKNKGGEKDKDSPDSGGGFFGNLFSSKTHEKFEGQFVKTLKSLNVEQTGVARPEQTGLQLARREALGPHKVPVPLPAIQRYAQRILDRLLQGSGVTGLETKVLIIADQQIHGEAFADGTIHLPLGAIRNLDTEDQMAALLAHELAHIILKHHDSDWFMDSQERGMAALEFVLETRERIKKARGKSGKENSLENLKMKYIGKGVVFASELLLNSPYTRVQEDEADLLGTDLLAAAGYSIDDMQELLSKLVTQEKQNLENARKRKEEQQLSLATLAEQNKKQGFLETLQSAAESLFDTVTDKITEEVGAKHRAAEQRQEAIGEYIGREYANAKSVVAEAEKWQAAKGTTEVKAAIEGYLQVYEARNAIDGDDYEAAVQFIQTALKKLPPQHGPPLLVAGLISGRAGLKDEAALFFNRSLSSANPVLTAYTGYAELLRGQNKLKESAAILARGKKELADAPQLLPAQIALLSGTTGRPAKQLKLQIEALLVQCKLSPLKNLAKTCKKARDGKYVVMPPLTTDAKQSLSGSAKLVQVTINRLNARQGPGTNFEITGSFAKGTTLFVLKKNGGWIRVAASDARSGWVAAKYTRAKTTSKANKLIRRSPPPPKSAHPVSTSQEAPVAKPSNRAAGKNDITARLKKLKQLHDQGLITKQEFDAKRAKILESL